MEFFNNDLRDFIKNQFGTGSKNATECCIFLYFNSDRSYTLDEIYTKVENNIASPFTSPERTFATEVRKYTNNSPQELKVSHTQLFTITDFKKPQKIELIKNIRERIDEFSKKKTEAFIKNTDFLEALKELFEYSKKILKFFQLGDEDRNLLINEIYRNNSLEYFKQIEDNINKKGPIQVLRYNILTQFIRDKKQELDYTQVSIEFIKKTIEQLCEVGFNGKIFNKQSFDRSWIKYDYTRILLYFYDYKYKIENKRRFLTLVKFILLKLNLEESKDIIDLRVDNDGRIRFRDKSPRAKTVFMKNSAFSIIDFEARSNNKYYYDPWIAIFPSKFKDHQRAYQFFLNMKPDKTTELYYGLHPGSNTITNLCQDNKNLKEITLDFSSEALIEEVIGFYSRIIPEYNRLNNLENKYRNYENINCWFVSPQPPDETVKPVKELGLEKSMFEIMMNRNLFAIGWSELQEDLGEIDLDNIKVESLSDDVIKMYKAIKNEIEIGDIIVAKKGGPDKKIYSIGFVTSNYKYDKTFDDSLKIKRHCYHYREIEWVINFYKDFKKDILKNEYFVSVKEEFESLKVFPQPTLILKDFNFYLDIKNSVLNKLSKLPDLNENQIRNYKQKFEELVAKVRCNKAYLASTKENFWIFQSNPEKFDIELAVREINRDTFTVNQHRQEIKEGDHLLFWVSGQESGIIAYGEVISSPSIMYPNEKANKFIKDESLKTKQLRVWVSYKAFNQKLLKTDILKYPEEIISNIPILKNAQGTNFKISGEIWKFLTEGTGLGESRKGNMILNYLKNEMRIF